MNLSDVRIARIGGKFVRDTLGLVLGVVATAAIGLLSDAEFVDALKEAVKDNPVLAGLVPFILSAGIAAIRGWQDATKGADRG